MFVTSIMTWTSLGLVSGLTANKVKGGGQWLSMEMTLGVLGAFVGGTMYHLVRQTEITGINLGSGLASILGAAAVLVVYHVVAGRSAPA
jgi:uncharacterized membrane protein YeaQ/YmgE (transglycosylase-associated protein family)